MTDKMVTEDSSAEFQTVGIAVRVVVPYLSRRVFIPFARVQSSGKEFIDSVCLINTSQAVTTMSYAS